MCGILAVYQQNPQWSQEQLTQALHTLTRRGPDSWGCWQDDRLYLGHRRLSIIDLDSGGQPMLSHDGRYIITFNGEIYNYRELRAQLRADGHTFITNSDTEVILEAYRRWGVDCLQRVAGMFAFALWDAQERTLFVVRDRVGIKPLYWSYHHGDLVVASTLSPFLALLGFPPQLDYEAVRDVLAYDYVMTPRSMLQHVQRLPPGHMFLWHAPHQLPPTVQAYWRVPAPSHDDHLTHEERVNIVESRLEQAVMRQMVSDVPLGAFLSGGIDSSLIAMFMARHSSQPVKTFTVSFKNGSNEAPIAQEVAQYLGTDHTILESEEVTSEQLLHILGALDEPLSDPTLVPTFALSHLAKQYVTVALSGDGGDELMGGYPKYLLGENRGYGWHSLLRPAKWLIDHMPARPIFASRLYWRTLSQREFIRYTWTRYGQFPVFSRDLKQLLMPDAFARVHADAFFDSWATLAARWGDSYDGETLMRVDMTTYLSENCLFKTDRASMLASLEVRVPFLDELLLDEVLAWPMNVKIVDGQLKALLLPICQRLLPQAVWDRPKQGFTVPLGHMMAVQWSDAIQNLLDWGRQNAPIFKYDFLQQLVEFNCRTRNVTRGLWSPIVVLAWIYANRESVTL